MNWPIVDDGPRPLGWSISGEAAGLDLLADGVWLRFGVLDEPEDDPDGKGGGATGCSFGVTECVSSEEISIVKV
jgi:hypothetical protein